MDYGEYLKSKEWAAKASEAKERDGFKCRLCNSEMRLQVHHRTYERVGSESIDDLTTLCGPCHSLYSAAVKIAKPTSGRHKRGRKSKRYADHDYNFDMAVAVVPKEDDGPPATSEEVTEMMDNLRKKLGW